MLVYKEIDSEISGIHSTIVFCCSFGCSLLLAFDLIIKVLAMVSEILYLSNYHVRHFASQLY